MGLDISVREPEGLNGRNPQDIKDFILMQEHPELSIFEDLAFERENEYYDLEFISRLFIPLLQ